MNIRNYTLIADQILLGQGQFGRVYRGQKTQNHR